ncbi:hypothetical protein GGS21DRAFT_547707 [Xylaria nigripes]|nr:hypothetical protein GGS21DRAFT_547707 [Xylaria nigripes]
MVNQFGRTRAVQDEANNTGRGAQQSQSGISFCEALFFFYSCGCRSRHAVMCCRPQRHDGVCQHEKPTIVVAKLPFACQARSDAASVPGETDRCRIEDPGVKKFVREVDTAESLDLLVLDDCPGTDLNTALPLKVRYPFTLVDVLHRRNELKGLNSSKGLSARAVEFVPTSAVVPDPRTNEEIDVSSTSSHQSGGNEYGGITTSTHMSGRHTPHKPISKEKNRSTNEEESIADKKHESLEDSVSERFSFIEKATSEGLTPEKEESTPDDHDDDLSYDDMIAIWRLQEVIAESTPPTRPWRLPSLLGGLFGVWKM